MRVLTVNLKNKNISIAVLPFQVSSNDERIKTLFIGFTEDLITNFSKFIGLSVISSFSTQRIEDISNKDEIDKLNLIEWTNDDWEFLSYLHFVLKPFYLATVMMSGKYYPSIGLIFHVIQKIKQFCSNDNTSRYHINPLRTELL